MIILQNEKSTIAFQEIKGGNVFQYEGTIYMKLKEENVTANGCPKNTVRLCDGHTCFFDYYIEVIPKSCFLNVH